MKKEDGALNASWRGLENTVCPETALLMWAAALGAYSFVLLLFSPPLADVGMEM